MFIRLLSLTLALSITENLTEYKARPPVIHRFGSGIDRGPSSNAPTMPLNKTIDCSDSVC